MDPITATRESSQAPVNAITTDNVQELGREVFLRLLVTQLESQDPTSPVENEDFIAQLAQFSSLEQTTNINDNLKGLIEQSERQSKLDLLNLIGREVVSKGDIVQLKETGDAALTYVLEDDAREVTIGVFNSNNRPVKKFELLGGQLTGQHELRWDGTDQEGDRVDAGKYTFRVAAKNTEGGLVSATTYMRDTVKSAVISDSNPFLTLTSGKTLLPDDVLAVETQ